MKRISPAHAVGGTVRLPGDKSISHRYSMLASVAEGTSKIHNYASGADCHSTLGFIGDLGIPVIYGLSFGHIRDQFTLPVGIEAEIDTAMASMTFLETAVV